MDGVVFQKFFGNEDHQQQPTDYIHITNSFKSLKPLVPSQANEDFVSDDYLFVLDGLVACWMIRRVLQYILIPVRGFVAPFRCYLRDPVSDTALVHTWNRSITRFLFKTFKEL